ncbi:MAG: hypothetical protein JJE04_16450 [Acidobacteriia bacterium]|nr:hypothetical protein [Terriglobia bacterium]
MTARFKGFSGPIGSGKSQALCQEAIRLSYVNAGRAGLIGAPTYPMLRDATQAAFLEVLSQNELPYELNKANQTLTMKDTGSKIIFRALGDFDRLRGTNLAWFGVDELTYTAEEAWLRLEGRLRDPKAKLLCGFAVWTPKGNDWVYRRFLANTVEGYEVVLAPPNENRHLLDRVPDFYERLKKSYDDRFYRQEVLGEYINSNGYQVYEAFERGKHVKTQSAREDLPLMWTLDFNVDPMCSLVVQITGSEIRVLDEIVLKRASTADACAEFTRRFGGRARRVIVYGDATGNRWQTAGSSDYQVIRDYFSRQSNFQMSYRVPRSNPSVRDRIGLMNAKLCDAAGEVAMWMDGKCRELIRDLEEVSYRVDSGEIDKQKDASRTHLSDALGYLLWQEFGPRQPIGEQKKRLI